MPAQHEMTTAHPGIFAVTLVFQNGLPSFWHDRTWLISGIKILGGAAFLPADDCGSIGAKAQFTLSIRGSRRPGR